MKTGKYYWIRLHKHAIWRPAQYDKDTDTMYYDGICYPSTHIFEIKGLNDKKLDLPKNK